MTVETRQGVCVCVCVDHVSIRSGNFPGLETSSNVGLGQLPCLNLDLRVLIIKFHLDFIRRVKVRTSSGKLYLELGNLSAKENELMSFHAPVFLCLQTRI